MKMALEFVGKAFFQVTVTHSYSTTSTMYIPFSSIVTLDVFDDTILACVATGKTYSIEYEGGPVMKDLIRRTYTAHINLPMMGVYSTQPY